MSLLLTALAIVTAAYGQADCAPAPLGGTGVSPVSYSRRESLNMPYMPGAGRTAPPHSVQFDSHVSVQVNVDANGNNILGDAANEPSIAVDLTNPSRMAIGWRQFDCVCSDFRQAGYGYSTDGGKHWTFPGVLEENVFRTDPVLATDLTGRFFYQSLTGENLTNCDVFRSSDAGAHWQSHVAAFGGDKNWMTIDQTLSIGSGNIYCIWRRPFSCCGSGIFCRSTNAGNSFQSPVPIPQDPGLGTISVLADGTVIVAGVLESDYSQFRIAKSTSARDSSLTPAWDSVTSVDMGGYLLFLDGGPNPGGLLGQVWVASDRSRGAFAGNLYLLCSLSNHKTGSVDVVIVQSRDGGSSWSPTVRINDDDPYYVTYHWFGTMSVAPNGRIDVIWNDTRHSPSNLYISELYYSASYDGGVTWSPNEQLSPAWDSSVGWPQQNKIGDYYHMISDNVGANLAYAATFNGEQDVWFLRIGDYLCQGLVAEQPASPSVCMNSAVSLHTSAAPRGGTVTYQWRKDGVNLSDTANIFGTQSQTLAILHAQLSDAGYYECLLKLEGCGAEMTHTAKLSVFATGSADGNADGQANGQDITRFVSALVNHDPVSATVCAYDLNADGIVDQADLAPFVARLLVSG